jgi:hypothetical protein
MERPETEKDFKEIHFLPNNVNPDVVEINKKTRFHLELVYTLEIATEGNK